MSPKTFSTIDIVACIVVTLLLLFLFIYPYAKLSALRDDIAALCGEVIADVNAERWEEARARAGEIEARITKDRTLLRFVFDHEDVDNAFDALKSAQLMLGREDGTMAILEIEHVRSIVIYLAGIETFTWDNLF